MVTSRSAPGATVQQVFDTFGLRSARGFAGGNFHGHVARSVELGRMFARCARKSARAIPPPPPSRQSETAEKCRCGLLSLRNPTQAFKKGDLFATSHSESERTCQRPTALYDLKGVFMSLRGQRVEPAQKIEPTRFWTPMRDNQ